MADHDKPGGLERQLIERAEELGMPDHTGALLDPEGTAALLRVAADALAECRRHLAAMLKQCPCGGDGKVAIHEYDAASGEMEWSGFAKCSRCAGPRTLLAKLKGEGKGDG